MLDLGKTQIGKTPDNLKILEDMYKKLPVLYEKLNRHVEISEIQRIYKKQYQEILDTEKEIDTNAENLTTNGYTDLSLKIYQIWQNIIFDILQKNPQMSSTPYDPKKDPNAGFCKMGRPDLIYNDYINIGLVTFDELIKYEQKLMTVKEIRDNYNKEFDKAQNKRISKEIMFWSKIALQNDGSIKKNDRR